VVSDGDRPNILVIWGDDIGITNLSCYGEQSFTIDQAVDKLQAALTTGQ
jgi:arylsulfatase A-like enzyme